LSFAERKERRKEGRTEGRVVHVVFVDLVVAVGVVIVLVAVVVVVVVVVVSRCAPFPHTEPFLANYFDIRIFKAS